MGEPDEPLENRKFRWERLRFLIASLGGACLFLVGLWQFSITARNDFARPVLEKQIELCMDASESAARLAQPVNRKAADWRDGPVASRFLALYFGKLGVVEDRCLYGAMLRFKRALFDRDDAAGAGRLALTISFACRRLLSKNWNAGLVGLYDPQDLIESFTDLDDYRQTMNAQPHCRLEE